MSISVDAEQFDRANKALAAYSAVADEFGVAIESWSDLALVIDDDDTNGRIGIRYDSEARAYRIEHRGGAM